MVFHFKIMTVRISKVLVNFAKSLLVRAAVSQWQGWMGEWNYVKKFIPKEKLFGAFPKVLNVLS